MRSQVDLTRSDVARYIQLSTLFRRRIEQGVWKPGERLPTVEGLAADCGVARATIRQAMDALEADGLIERYRARGTFVRANLPERLWCEVETDWSGLLRSRPGARIEILSEGEGVPPVLPEGRAPRAWHHVRRRHWRDGVAFLLADVWLDARLWPRVRAADLTRRTALSLVSSLRGVRITDARQTLTIGAADVEAAAGLGIPLNAPVAHVRRVAVDQRGVIALLADGVYRGDLVRMDVRLATSAEKVTD